MTAADQSDQTVKNRLPRGHPHMNDTVETKAQDTLTSDTSRELAVVIGTRTVEYHQGQRSYTAPIGRTYDRSRPKRSNRQKPLAKRPSTYERHGRNESPGHPDIRHEPRARRSDRDQDCRISSGPAVLYRTNRPDI